jgi:hypothetical protein
VIRQWPLIGRSEELAVIADASRTTADRAGGIMLSGSAGVGKTRLAREAVARCGPRAARRHWIVGTASARSVPLGAFADIASYFGPDPLRRVREVIDGLIGDARAGEVVVGVDDAHLLDDLSAFTIHQLVTRRLASVLAREGSTDPRDLVRQAVLVMESDLAPDPDLVLAATSAAMQLGDLRLAEMLAVRAVAAGGGLPAKIIQAMAITWQERGTDAEAILAELACETHGPTRAQIAILRAMNFALSLGDGASAERELEAIPPDDEAAQAVANALRALIDLVRGYSRAVDRASTILASTPANDIVHMLSVWVLVTGLGDLGRINEIESAADAGYQLAEASAEASHLRLPLAAVQVIAYRLAGALTSLDAMIARIRRDTIDVPFQQAWHSLFVGLSAMSRGELPAAQRSLQEAIAHLENGAGGRMTRTFARSWLAP